MSDTKWTPGPWRIENVSDAVRVVIGTGRQKIILARCATPQLPETQTEANARLMAVAPKLYEKLKEAWRILDDCAHDTINTPTGIFFRKSADECAAVLAKARGESQ